MHFDFYEQYKNLSNVELLKILQQPDAYQPLALEAAARILEERKVTIAELTQEQEKTDVTNKHSTDLLDSFPLTEEVKPTIWLKVFLAITALEYLWASYSTIISSIITLGYTGGRFKVLLFILPLFDIVFMPFVFYLLWKRKQAGWVLMFLSAYLVTVFRIGRVYAMYRATGLQTTVLIVILLIVVKIAFIFYLWRKEIREFFHVGKDVQFWTVLAVICSIVVLVSFIMA